MPPQIAPAGLSAGEGHNQPGRAFFSFVGVLLFPSIAVLLKTGEIDDYTRVFPLEPLFLRGRPALICPAFFRVAVQFNNSY